MNQKKSILLFSRLKLHGVFLNKNLSRFFDVSWIGKDFPMKISLINFVYILFREFFQTVILLRKKRFSLIMVQFISLDGLIALLFGKILNVKVVLHAIGSDVLKIDRKFYLYPILKFIIAKSDLVFCVSINIQNALLLMNIEKSKLKILPSLVTFNSDPFFSTEKIYDVVTIGTLDLNKNQLLLIKACESLPLLNILIIGDGPLYNTLKAESSKKNCSITFLGNIPHNEVFISLQKSRIYVHTSLSEGLPVAVIEAMYFGLPIILMESEYANNLRKYYGFRVHLFAKNSDEHLAHKILQILKNYPYELNKSISNKQKVLQMTAETSFNLKTELDNLMDEH